VIFQVMNNTRQHKIHNKLIMTTEGRERFPKLPSKNKSPNLELSKQQICVESIKFTFPACIKMGN